jgi:hypothetical protein
MQTIQHDGITYRFALIDIAGEDEWAADVREQAMQEAMSASDGWPIEVRAAFLAKVSTEASLAKCGFTADFGLVNLRTARGMAKALEIAARKAHPGVTLEAMLKVVKAKELDAARVALSVIPVSEESRKLMLGELDAVEKKVSGRTGGPLLPPSNSGAPSAPSPETSPPIRLAE